MGVLNTLKTRALRIYDENHLTNDKTHLLNVFNNNGYSRHQGLKAFLNTSKGPMIKKDAKDWISGVHFPFIQGTTNMIARILKEHKVLSTFRPLNIILSSLKFVKDPVDPNDMKRVYVISCSHKTPYIGENWMLNKSKDS